VDKVMDIHFILDSSSSIYVRDYDQELQFVRDVVSRLDVSPRATRVGVLTFSDDLTRPTIGLNQYSTKGDVLGAINVETLPYRTGFTNTDLAIRHVWEDPEFRQDITKVMVVVTDGGSRSPGATAQEARLAREQGFYMFVVGIGQFLEESEWRSIASDPDSSFIFNITHFRFLDSVKYALPPRACELPPIIMGGACNIQQSADLYFVAAPGGTQEAIQLIDHFNERTRDDDDSLQVSYVINNCDGGENVALGNLDRYCNRELAPLDPTASTNSNLMDRVQRLAEDNRAVRRGVPQVMVLFMNQAMVSRERGGYAMWQAASTLRNSGVEIVVVDLGVRGGSRTGGQYAGSQSNVVTFARGSIVDQMQAKTDFLDKTCAALSRRSGGTGGRGPRGDLS